MSNELRENTELVSVCGPQDNEGGQVYYCTAERAPAYAKAEAITVKMQPGQMGMVPWAEVLIQNRRFMVNLALMETVEVKEAEQ